MTPSGDRCVICSLQSETFVQPSGPLDARLMFVGRDPGNDEVLIGVPFVGKSGKYLRKKIREIFEISPVDTYITNLVKCHTPNNRGPTKTEVNLCSIKLKNELILICPEVVVALGKDAHQFFIDNAMYHGDGHYKMTLSGSEGTQFHEIDIIFAHHPSYVIHYNRHSEPEFIASLKKARSILIKKIYDNETERWKGTASKMPD